MPTYTGTADANGDFGISFGAASYTAGEKITVTATKDGASKSIELHAPSDVMGGGVIQFSGNLTNFPANIGNVTFGADLSGAIAANSFTAGATLFSKATGLTILGAVTSLGANCVSGWANAKFAILPNTVTSIGSGCFNGWSNLLNFIFPLALSFISDLCFYNCIRLAEIYLHDNITAVGQQAFRNCTGVLKVTLGASLASIGSEGLRGLSSCDEMICRRSTPPTLGSNALLGLKTTCVIKVPAASLAAYQAATGWSAFASQMVGV